MGNSIAKDFKNLKLGYGSVPAEEMIAPGSMVLKRPATILIKWDDHRKSTIYFDLSTMLPLYLTKTKSQRKGSFTSITEDEKGRALFITISSSPNKHLIYRAPEEDPTASIHSNSNHSTTSFISVKEFLESGYDDLPKPRQKSDSNANTSPSNRPKQESNCGHSHEKSKSKESKTSKLDPGLDKPSRQSFCLGSSNHSSASISLVDLNCSDHSSHSFDEPRVDTYVPCAAQIKVMRSGAAVTAAMFVSVPSKTGTEFVVCYKASKIPAVKFGALITDMTGEVVGKSSFDEARMNPVIKVAPGADLPCVLAIASAILRDV